jgi:hypothetical protein
VISCIYFACPVISLKNASSRWRSPLLLFLYVCYPNNCCFRYLMIMKIDPMVGSLGKKIVAMCKLGYFRGWLYEIPASSFLAARGWLYGNGRYSCSWRALPEVL